jgi:Protein of unknown function (DUF2569)
MGRGLLRAWILLTVIWLIGMGILAYSLVSSEVGSWKWQYVHQMRKEIDINKVDWSRPYYENMRSPSKEKLSVTFSEVGYEFVDTWNKRVKDGYMVIVPMRDGSTLYLDTDLTKADQHYVATAFRNQRWSRYLNVTKTWIAILLVPPIILLILGWALLWVARGFKQEKPILAEFIDKPPPLPQTSQPRKSGNSQQQEQTTLSKSKQLNADPKLTGIGGWLILVALGQILGPIKFLVSIGQYYSTLDSNIIGKLPVTFAGEAVINFFVLVLSIYTAVLFFRKSRQFPRFFVYEILAAIFLVPLGAMWTAVAASMETGQSARQLLQTALGPSEIGQTIAAAIIGSVWILYIFKSKRVANTFTV